MGKSRLALLIQSFYKATPRGYREECFSGVKLDSPHAKIQAGILHISS